MSQIESTPLRVQNHIPLSARLKLAAHDALQMLPHARNKNDAILAGGASVVALGGAAAIGIYASQPSSAEASPKFCQTDYKPIGEIQPGEKISQLKILDQ